MAKNHMNSIFSTRVKSEQLGHPELKKGSLSHTPLVSLGRDVDQSLPDYEIGVVTNQHRRISVLENTFYMLFKMREKPD